jgi:DNA-binding GntR family transcriptional regulator
MPRKTSSVSTKRTSPRAPDLGPSGAIAVRLEEDIVLGRLQPRERLVEQDLANRFGTHRAAVRQALFDLDKKGLIERVPNRGALVRDLSPDEVRQIYAVREELEAMAGRIIPLPVAASDIKRLEAIQKVHSRAVAAADLRAVFHSNLQFHRALFGLCGNQYLIESIEQLAQKVYGIRSWSNAIPEYLQRVKQDHFDMLDALRDGHRAELVRLFRRHLAPSRDVYIQAYQQRFGTGLQRRRA